MRKPRTEAIPLSGLLIVLVQIFAIAEAKRAALAMHEVVALALRLGVNDHGLPYLAFLVLANGGGGHFRLCEFPRHPAAPCSCSPPPTRSASVLAGARSSDDGRAGTL